MPWNLKPSPPARQMCKKSDTLTTPEMIEYARIQKRALIFKVLALVHMCKLK